MASQLQVNYVTCEFNNFVTAKDSVYNGHGYIINAAKEIKCTNNILQFYWYSLSDFHVQAKLNNKNLM